MATGLTTYLGGMSSAIVDQQAPTSFDRGMSRFTWLMICFMLVMVPLVFVINGLTKDDWKEAFFFALAVAVGLTPEMLPMIVAVCLSKGAMAMSRKKVIVKRLNSIQNLGAMDVLCTDKTGTLTMDRIILEKHCDVVLKEDDEVLTLAYLNSHFQTGLKNVLDRAILQHTEVHEHPAFPEYAKVDEIPFDFSRRMMSVVVKTPGNAHRLICKGAPEEVFKRCSSFELDGEIYPMDHVIPANLKEEFDQLSADGFRVLALAYRDLEPKAGLLQGRRARPDPARLRGLPRPAQGHRPVGDRRPAGARRRGQGAHRRQRTGEPQDLPGGRHRHRPRAPGQPGRSDVRRGTGRGRRARRPCSPGCRRPTSSAIIKALQGAGHVVGFLGDGINDAPALRAADVGISVDTAVDIAKESADVILLEKDLLVLEEGVLEGRKVFANILKYIRMGASSNFGNMFSVLGASVFLPFVPDGPASRS